MKHRPLVALTCAVLVATAACSQSTAHGIALLPAAQRTDAVRAYAPASKTLLYSSTLDWNTGTGAVYAYDAYSNDSHPLKVLQL